MLLLQYHLKHQFCIVNLPFLLLLILLLLLLFFLFALQQSSQILQIPKLNSYEKLAAYVFFVFFFLFYSLLYLVNCIVPRIFLNYFYSLFKHIKNTIASSNFQYPTTKTLNWKRFRSLRYFLLVASFLKCIQVFF